MSSFLGSEVVTGLLPPDPSGPLSVRWQGAGACHTGASACSCCLKPSVPKASKGTTVCACGETLREEECPARQRKAVAVSQEPGSPLAPKRGHGRHAPLESSPGPSPSPGRCTTCAPAEARKQAVALGVSNAFKKLTWEHSLCKIRCTEMPLFRPGARSAGAVTRFCSAAGRCLCGAAPQPHLRPGEAPPAQRGAATASLRTCVSVGRLGGVL